MRKPIIYPMRVVATWWLPPAGAVSPPPFVCSVHTMSAVLRELQQRRPADVLLLWRLLPRPLPGTSNKPVPPMPARVAVS